MCCDRLLESEASHAEPLRRPTHNETAKALAKDVRVDTERVANAIERERIVRAAGVHPLASFGECAPFAGAAEAMPSLEDVDRVDQHREHEALFRAEAAPAHRREKLARKDNVREIQRIACLELTFGRFHRLKFLPRYLVGVSRVLLMTRSSFVAIKRL